MHLLFASHSADLLGAERSLIPLVQTAAQVRDHRVTVTVPADGPLCAELTAAGATVVVLPTRSWMGKRFNLVVGSIRLVQALLSVPRYRRLLDQLRPDVVVTNSAVLPAPALAARRLGLPHLWLVQESLLTNPSLRSALPRTSVARFIVRNSAQLITVSAYAAGQLTEACPEANGKLTIVPPSIDPVPLVKSASEEPALRRLAIFGRFTPEKGQLDALQALAACARAGHRLRLTFAGVGADGAGLVASAAAQYGVADLVDVVEWTDEPLEIYRSSDATLMLSRNEAFGRVTVESLMAGVPVIGYRAGATTELLAGGGGLLTESNPAALADALVRLAEDTGTFAAICSAARDAGRKYAENSATAAAVIDLVECLR